MWEHFEQGDGLFSKEGLHLNKRGAAVLGKGFLRDLGDVIKLGGKGGAYLNKGSHGENYAVDLTSVNNDIGNRVMSSGHNPVSGLKCVCV